MNVKFNTIGIVEISFYTNALIALDCMLKVADVHLIACEKKLGGRMVSIIVGGDTSAVYAAIEAVREIGSQVGEKNIKVAVAIPNPHEEIKKLLHLITYHKTQIEPLDEVEDLEQTEGIDQAESIDEVKQLDPAEEPTPII